MFKCVSLSAALVLSLALGLPAQEGTLTVTPDDGPMGGQRVITLTAPGGAGIITWTPTCLWSSVNTGGPSGGTTFLTSPSCFPSQTLVPACTSISQTWSISGVLSAGTYWMSASYQNAVTGTYHLSWTEFRVGGGGNQTALAQVAPPVRGTPWNINISHPADPAAGYFAAASLTTNVGVPFGNDWISLDIDFLFSLSFPTPLPGLFSGFQGGLDSSGGATMTVFIPDVAVLDCMGIRVQAVLLSPGGQSAVTNCVDAFISPN